MSKTYTPREGTIPARAITILQGSESISTQDLADALGTEAKSLHANLALAVRHGLIRAENDAGKTIWGLGDGTAAAEDSSPEEQAEDTFACALYNDGDLVLINAGTDGDVNIKIPKAQANTLVRYLMSFAHEDEAAA